MRKFPIYLALLALTLSCAREESTVETKVTDTEVVDEAYIPGKTRIYLSEEMAAMLEESDGTTTKSAEMNQALEGLGVVSIERLFPYAGEYEGRTRREGLHRWYVVEYDASASTTKASSDLLDVEGVEKVVPIRKVKSSSIFNDKYLYTQWGLINSTTEGADINVQRVWKYFTTGSPDVIVGVVDEGIDRSHEDLKYNCLSSGYNFVTKSTTITGGDHGSHVAGIIAGVNNNKIGICGVAGGNYAEGKKGTGLLSCQIFTDDDSGDTGQAIKWAADNGAVICNNSWGYDYDYNDDGKITGREKEDALSDTIDEVDKAAVDYFIKYAGCDDDGNQKADSPMKGGVVFFAAGNDGLENGAPANYEPVVAVGAMTEKGKKAYFSNYGDWVDIAAPGDEIASTCTSNSYYYMSGTSMACPYASGVAALVLAYRGGQGFTADDLKECIIKGANYNLFSDNTDIGPMLDAYGAITYGLETIAQTPTDLSAEANSNNITASWKVAAELASIPEYGVRLFYTTDKSAYSSLDIASPGIDYVDLLVDSLEVGDVMSTVLKDMEFSTTYYLAVAGYNHDMEFSQLSNIVEVTTGENNAPVIEADSSLEDLNYNASRCDTIYFNIYDPDGHDFTMSYSSGSAADSFSEVSDGVYRLIIDGSTDVEGTFTATITATDAYGLTTVQDIVYTMLVNNAPVLSVALPNRIIYGVPTSYGFALSDYFNDPDGDNLDYSITTAARTTLAVSCEDNGDATLTSRSYGSANVHVTVSDPRGASATGSFKVLIRKEGVKVAAYPNPVTTTLYIETGEELCDTELKLVSETGSVLYNSTVQCSAFEPAELDMSTAAPGRYSLTVSWQGQSYTQAIVKY